MKKPKNDETVLAIMAHPGDAGVLCSGTLARLAAMGAKVALACVTDGAGGNRLINIPAPKLAAMRRKHEQAAAKVIGADLHWLGLPDGSLFLRPDHCLAIIDLIREVRPTLLITHNPDDFHPDNREVSQAVFSAAGVAPVQNIITQHEAVTILPALYYTDSWISRGFVPSDYVDITATYAQKARAVRQNKIGVRWLRDFDNMSIFDLVEIAARQRGFQCGCRYAEAFRQDTRWPIHSTYRRLP